MAGQIPQHDGEGRSATILPGVPLPDWALPDGPIEPEPEAAAEQPSPPPAEEQHAPELVSVGAVAAGAAVDDTIAMAPVAPPSALAPSAPAPSAPAPTAPAPSSPAPSAPAPSAAGPSSPSPYGTALPLGAAAGPGPMRAGWDYPGSDFREQAHDEALAEQAEAEADLLDAAPAGPDADAVPVALAPPTGAPLTAPAPDAVVVPDSPAGLEDAAPVDADQVGTAEAGEDAEGAQDGDPNDGEDATGSRRSPLALLAVLGVVLVLGAVAAFVWPGLLVSQDPEPAAVVPQAAAPVAPAAPAAVELSTPSSVGPYVKLSGAPDAALSKAVTGTTLPGLTSPVSAVYGTGTTPAVTVIAWKSAGPVGTDAVAAAFGGFQGATSAVVTGITTVPVSDGGQMQCGTTVVGGSPASLCFWGDEATFGSVTVLKPASPEAAADTATAVRAAVTGS